MLLNALRRPLVIIVVLYGIAAGLTAAAVPLWGGHEADFYTVTRFLATNGRLPTADDYPAGDAEVRQATQPPLYFLITLPIMAMLDDGSPVPPGAHPPVICPAGEAGQSPLTAYPTPTSHTFPPMGAALAGYALRLLGLGMGMAAIVFTYHATRVLFPRWPATPLLAAALLAFEPNTLAMTVTISNDGLLLLLAAITLWALAKFMTSQQAAYAALAAVCAGLAPLTRLQGWALLGLAALVISGVIGGMLNRRHGRALLLPLGVLAGVIVVSVGVLAFNYAQYGSVLGRYTLLDALIAEALTGFSVSPATFFGIIDHTRLSYLEPLATWDAPRIVRLAYTALPVVLIGCAVVGVGLAVIRRRERAAWLLLLAGIGAAWALVIFRTAIFSTADNTTAYNTGFIFAPLRYYATALPALAVLFAGGLCAVGHLLAGAAGQPRTRTLIDRLTIAGGLGVAAVWLGVTLIEGGLAAQRPALPVIAASAVPVEAVRIAPDIGADDEIRVIAYTVDPRPAQGTAIVTLYARAATALSYYARFTFGSLGDETAVSALPCEVLPARGDRPTFTWPTNALQTAETVVVMTVSVPYCGTPTADPPLRLTWHGATLDGTVVTRSITYDLGGIPGSFAPAPACPPLFGQVAGLRAVGFNSPPAVRRGEVYLPSVNWIVTVASPQIAGRLFVFQHTASGVRYGCTGLTHVRTPAQWRTGEYVYFDGCPFTFPPDAPTGDYTVLAGLTAADGSLLPGVGTTGDPLAEGLIVIGAFTLDP